MKAPTSLLCWKSHFQTQLPTALFSTHYPGFAASSAPGNFSPHSQLMFLAENWATVNIWHDQFCSPTKYDWPFSSDPNQCLLLLICFTFYLTLNFFCSHVPQSFLSSIQRSLYLSCAECLQSQKIFLWVKCSPYVLVDLLPCQKLSDTCPGLACSHLRETSCSCLAPDLGVVCQPCIFHPPRQVDRSQGMQVQGHDQLPNPAGEWPEKLLVCIWF